MHVTVVAPVVPLRCLSEIASPSKQPYPFEVTSREEKQDPVPIGDVAAKLTSLAAGNAVDGFLLVEVRLPGRKDGRLVEEQERRYWSLMGWQVEVDWLVKITA